MKRELALLIGGPLNGGIVTAMIWWVVNDLWKVRGIGLLERQPWPVSSIYVCAGIGAALGLVLGIILVLRRAGHADRIAALCQRLNLQYVRDVAREQLTRYHGLRLFEIRRWQEAANLMSGTYDGVEVELLDYEFVEHGDESTTHYRQTVALFPECGNKLPPFELAPRGLMIKLFYRVAGVEGITFEPAEFTSGWDRDVIERFRQLYFLMPRMDEVLRAAEQRRVRNELGTEVDEALPVSSEPAIRRLFNVELLRVLADRPGWSVESDGVNLAVWRSRRIVPAADRDEFIRQAVPIRSAIANANVGKATAAPLPGTTKMLDPRSQIAGTGAWALGAFLGFIIGGAIGFGAVGLLVWLMKDPPVALVFPIFFGCPISGFIVGGIINHRRQHRQRVVSSLSDQAGFQGDGGLCGQPQQPVVKLETAEVADGMTTLQVGSRTVTVECRPLQETESGNFRTRRLVRHGEQLVLRPSHGARLFALMLLVTGAGFVAMGIAAPSFWRDWPAELGGVLGTIVWNVLYPIVWLAALLFSGCGLLILFGTSGLVLDRKTGRLHYVPNQKWRSARRPLTDIIAVQFIRGEMHSAVVASEQPYRTYQLNLVLDDPAEPRINLCDHTDVAWQLETGREIAHFLDRPIIDQVSDSGSVIPARDGKAER